MNGSLKTLSILIFCIITMMATVSQGIAQETEAEKLLAAPTLWRNERGSTMSLTFNNDPSGTGNYSLSGTYINRASGFGCQNTPYPIVGWYYANTQTLSFTVIWNNNFENCQSVTGWTGYINIRSTPITMPTKWNLAYMSSQGQQIESGTDQFTFIPSLSRSSLKKSE